MCFSHRLAELRNNSDMTQKELAEKLGVSRGTIGMYEIGQRDPDTDTLIMLSEIFGVSTDYLLGKTDIKNPYEIQTIAAHHDGDEFTEEELKSIEEFKEFVRMRREQKDK